MRETRRRSDRERVVGVLDCILPGRVLLTVLVEIVLEGPTTTIQTWLKLAEPTLQRCLKDAHHKLTTNQTDIRDYFDEISYAASGASDTTLSFDTLDTLGNSGSIIFNDSIPSSSSSVATASSRISTGSDSTYSDSDACPSSG